MTAINIVPADLCIELECGIGETDVTFAISDIYATWKDWFLVSDNSKYLQAMDSAGGDPLGGGEKLGRAYFLLTGNGWRICPKTTEVDVRIVLDGNLFPSPAGDILFDYSKVVANGQTHIEMRTSTLPTLQETGVSGLTPSESANLNIINQVEIISNQILALNQQMNKLVKLIPAAV